MSIFEQEKRPEQLPLERLETGIGQIMEIAAEYQLDPYPIQFEIIPPSMMHAFAAYGIPGRYSHWIYGRAFRQQKTLYDYGLARIYEMVVNANPSPAYLLENNSVISNLMVAAHVVGHVDFFKHNYLFESTSRDMPALAETRAARLREYEKKYGRKAVEEMLDAALSISDHIDPSNHYRLSKNELIAAWKQEVEDKKNPPVSEFDALEQLTRETKPASGKKKMRIPLKPDSDLLGFIRDFAPDLEDWEQDIIDIVREDSYYLYPQYRTKIMNEGWAVLYHKLIMHEMANRGHLTTGEAEEWWLLHSGVARPHKDDLNPYWFGMMMWQWLWDYYNGALDEKETQWLVENDWPVYPRFEGRPADCPAIPRIRQIMATHDDISFIRNYFNYIPATRMNAYLYEVFDDGEEKTTFIVTTSWVEIRDGLINMLQRRTPKVAVIESDFKNQQELVLEHFWDGEELENQYTEKTLVQLGRLWKRKRHLITYLEEKQVLYTCEEGKVTLHQFP